MNTQGNLPHDGRLCDGYSMLTKNARRLENHFFMKNDCL